MAGEEWDPEIERKMALIDAALARNRAIVASWGYGEAEITKEQREAEWRQLEREYREQPAHVLLGQQAEERKWQSSLLGKNMGLQASKPRNRDDNSTSAARRVREDSSDDEEGRTGLGRAKKSKHAHGAHEGDFSNKGVAESKLMDKPNEAKDAMMVDAHAISFQHILANAREEPNLEKVELWKQKTAKALTQSSSSPARASVSPSPASVQEPRFKTSRQGKVSQETALKGSVQTTFDKSDRKNKSKKRKLVEHDADLNGKLANIPKVTEAKEHEETPSIDGLSFSEAKQPFHQAGQSSTPGRLPTKVTVSRDPPVKHSEHPEGTRSNKVEKFANQDVGMDISGGQRVKKSKKDRRAEKTGGFVMTAVAQADSLPEVENPKAGTPPKADAEAMAKMRQLAREKLGSGSCSKQTGRAKFKGSNPTFAVNAEKKERKKSKKKKDNLLKADFK